MTTTSSLPPPPTPPAACCSGEPVSWLRLERYHESEVDAAEKTAIEQHLASCPACAACLARIREDDAVALPPLPSAPSKLSAPSGGAPEPRKPRLVWLRSPSPSTIAAAASALALAAAAVLGIGRGWWKPAGPIPGGAETEQAIARVKGGSIAFTLVRDDDERIEGASGVFRDGDRFKVLVTCPPTFQGGFDVVVFERGAEAAFPLSPSPTLACGNLVPLPGAMRLTGKKRETVCVVWSESGPVTRALAAAMQEGGGGARDDTRGLCKELEPAR
jgi:hypothetical protein